MRDLLQVAARSGSGSAARALGSGLAGIRTATRRTLIFGAMTVCFVYLGWDVFSGVTDTSRVDSTGESMITTDAMPSPSPARTPSFVGTNPIDASPAAADRVTYAIDVRDVAGLAPNVPPGTVVDIWVTWERPLAKTPLLQRLVPNAVVEQIAPPVTPRGPYVAVLSIDEWKVKDLLWGDRYGALSATIMPAA